MKHSLKKTETVEYVILQAQILLVDFSRLVSSLNTLQQKVILPGSEEGPRANWIVCSQTHPTIFTSPVYLFDDFQESSRIIAL